MCLVCVIIGSDLVTRGRSSLGSFSQQKRVVCLSLSPLTSRAGIVKGQHETIHTELLTFKLLSSPSSSFLQACRGRSRPARVRGDHGTVPEDN